MNVVQAFVRDLLAAVGVDDETAAIVADALCMATLRGIDSHGVFLLPHYVQALLAGQIKRSAVMNFEQTGPATGLLDADHGFGHQAAAIAMSHAIGLARKSGASWVGVANSSHCGVMGYFAELACEHDMIGIAMTHATPRVRSHNGIAPYFGANPIAFAFPMRDEQPLCFDSSVTTTTFNAIRLAQQVGAVLAPGMAADGKGEPTIDPEAACQLLPIGEHKGFALAMVVDCFCALLTGMPAGAAVSTMFDGSLQTPRRLGHMVGAVRIDAFVDPAIFRHRLAEVAREVRSQTPANPGRPVMVPGDPEKAVFRDRLANGLPLPASIVEELELLAETHSVRGLSDRMANG